MVKAFTVNNFSKKLSFIPKEDSFSFDDKNGIYSVADGVTRDPSEFLPDTKGFIGKAFFAFNYPRPSPAKIASDIFTKTFKEIILDYFPSNRGEKELRYAFDNANKRIGLWNKFNIPKPNYAPNDLAGCVCSAVILGSNHAHIGFLADSGVAIFDRNGELKFRTNDEGPSKLDSYFFKDERLKNKSWQDPFVRSVIRRDYRNNPSQSNSYGVLTGEGNVMYYVRTKTIEITRGDNIFVYTDGLEPVIFSKEFRDLIYRGDQSSIEKMCRNRVSSEGTLIYKNI